MRAVMLAQPFYRLHGSHNNRVHLGLHYLAEVLKDKGFEARVYNGDYEDSDTYADWPSIAANAWHWSDACKQGHDTFIDVAEAALADDPSHVFIAAGEVVTPTLNNGSVISAAWIANAIKQMNPSVKVVGYGPQFTFDDTVPSVFDHVIMFEGESVVPLLMKERSPPRVLNGGRVPANKMDALPFLRPETMDPRTPLKPLDFDYISGSRGCAFRCHYCLAPTFLGKTRYMSVDRYVAEMRYRYTMHGVRGLYCCDQTLTEDPRRLLQIAQSIASTMPDLKWWGEARVETLKPTMFPLLAESGCTSLKIGIEAGSPEMLRYFGKKTNLANAAKTVAALKKSGIKAVVYVLLGAPNATRREYLESYDFMASLNADYYVVNVTTAARGTKMFDKVAPALKEAGLYSDGAEEGFGHLSGEMRKFWGIDDDVFDLFMSLVENTTKEDAGTRRYVRRVFNRATV
jgi:radical SAM superfamily enzyme YgiQ (UPF0313 family)